jgi:hypothetical protein
MFNDTSTSMDIDRRTDRRGEWSKSSVFRNCAPRLFRPRTKHQHDLKNYPFRNLYIWTLKTKLIYVSYWGKFVPLLNYFSTVLWRTLGEFQMSVPFSARWKATRTQLTPAFTSGKIKPYFPLIAEVCEELQRCIENSGKADSSPRIV